MKLCSFKIYIPDYLFTWTREFDVFGEAATPAVVHCAAVSSLVCEVEGTTMLGLGSETESIKTLKKKLMLFLLCVLV